MDSEIVKYNEKQEVSDKEICDRLAELINCGLRGAESKVWQAHPVWFLEGNPIVGYSKQKRGCFWQATKIEGTWQRRANVDLVESG